MRLGHYYLQCVGRKLVVRPRSVFKNYVQETLLQNKHQSKTENRSSRNYWRITKARLTIFVTDQLRSYSVANWELIPEPVHHTSTYANNIIELLYDPTRVSRHSNRKFKRIKQALRFLEVYSVAYNLRGHLVMAEQYRNLGENAFCGLTRAIP